jgi:hypothetical protein
VLTSPHLATHPEISEKTAKFGVTCKLQAPCPPNLHEVAQEYLMRSLPEDEVEAFEVHYFACPACATILQKTAANVEAIRAAALKLRSEAPHQTSARSL